MTKRLDSFELGLWVVTKGAFVQSVKSDDPKLRRPKVLKLRMFLLLPLVPPMDFAGRGKKGPPSG